MSDLREIELAVVPLRDSVLFPHVVQPITIGRTSSMRLLDAVDAKGALVAVLTQRAPSNGDGDVPVYEIRTCARVHTVTKSRHDPIRYVMLVEGAEARSGARAGAAAEHSAGERRVRRRAQQVPRHVFQHVRLVVRRQDQLADAAATRQIMVRKAVRRLVVLDRQGHLAGIASVDDLATVGEAESVPIGSAEPVHPIID